MILIKFFYFLFLFFFHVCRLTLVIENELGKVVDKSQFHVCIINYVL